MLFSSPLQLLPLYPLAPAVLWSILPWGSVWWLSMEWPDYRQCIINLPQDFQTIFFTRRRCRHRLSGTRVWRWTLELELVAESDTGWSDDQLGGKGGEGWRRRVDWAGSSHPFVCSYWLARAIRHPVLQRLEVAERRRDTSCFSNTGMRRMKKAKRICFIISYTPSLGFLTQELFYVTISFLNLHIVLFYFPLSLDGSKGQEVKKRR